jgi:hypothetical protein
MRDPTELENSAAARRRRPTRSLLAHTWRACIDLQQLLRDPRLAEPEVVAGSRDRWASERTRPTRTGDIRPGTSFLGCLPRMQAMPGALGALGAHRSWRDMLAKEWQSGCPGARRARARQRSSGSSSPAARTTSSAVSARPPSCPRSLAPRPARVPRPERLAVRSRTHERLPRRSPASLRVGAARSSRQTTSSFSNPLFAHALFEPIRIGCSRIPAG